MALDAIVVALEIHKDELTSTEVTKTRERIFCIILIKNSSKKQSLDIIQ